MFCPHCDKRLMPDHRCLSRRIFLFAGLGGLFAAKVVAGVGCIPPGTTVELPNRIYFIGHFWELYPGARSGGKTNVARLHGLAYFDDRSTLPGQTSFALTRDQSRAFLNLLRETRTP